jgi:DNA topoisomerase-1
MASAVFDSTAVTIVTDTPYVFRAHGLTKKFEGFLKVWRQQTKEEILPELAKGDDIALKELLPERHETQPPPRFSEATLVKTLEEHGIGRPSTYAPIMSTIQDRGYVEKDEQRRFFPTEVGTLVNDLLVEHFPSIVDVQFTAGMEEDLDNIAEGKKEWAPVIAAFYGPFSKTLEAKEKELKKSDIKKDTPTDKACPVCGKPVVIKLGRFGKFYACSGFPECKHTENFVETINMKCPLCSEGDVVIKRTKRRRMFYGCSRYPDCTFASWKDPREAEKVEAEAEKKE